MNTFTNTTIHTIDLDNLATVTGGDGQRAGYTAEDLGQGVLWGAAGATAGAAGGPIGAGLGGAAGFGAGFMSRNVTNLSNGLRDLWSESARGRELDRQRAARSRR
ncbi:MAG: hypothetical protein ABI867_20405 [Kofleriaceae bacterium]